MEKRMMGKKALLAILILALMIPVSLVAEAKGSVGAGPNEETVGTKSVVIGFKEPAKGLAVAEVKASGGVVSKSFKHMSMVAAELTEEEIQELSKNSNVEYIEEDIIIESMGEEIPWGVEMTEAPALWTHAAGDGIKVAILDTGVDINHVDLTFQGGVNTIDGSSYSGTANHGSHVSGIVGAVTNNTGVVGMAPYVELNSVKVLADDGKGSLSALIAGLDWAVENDMDIVNMSLGTSTDTEALREAVDKAYNAGILLVAAAGNSGTEEGTTDTIKYPAKYESVIAVGAVNSSNIRAPFSATGPDLELTAPGVSIRSTIPGDRYALASGTSMAAPHVTGAAALIWSQNPEFSNVQVRYALRDGAQSTGSAFQYGYGIINLSQWAPVSDPGSNPEQEPEDEPIQEPEEEPIQEPEGEPVQEPKTSQPLCEDTLEIVLTIGSKMTLVNNVKKYMDVSPYIDSAAKRTMVPVRFISETMGATVSWDSESKKVTIKTSEHTIVLTIGSKTVIVDNKIVLLDVYPRIKNCRTYVPIRFISETLGAEVLWDGTTQKVFIEK